MIIELTPEQIVEFAESEYFRIGDTSFQITSSGESIHTASFTYKYHRRIGGRSDYKVVNIYSNNPLTKNELSLILSNPFVFVDEHPFSH